MRPAGGGLPLRLLGAGALDGASPLRKAGSVLCRRLPPARRAAVRQGARRRAGGAVLRPHGGGVRRQGRHAAHHRPAGGRRRPPSLRRRGANVPRQVRRVRRDGRRVPLRRHPRRAGHPPAGEGHERRPPRQRRRPRRLRTGQCRLHRRGDTSLLRPAVTAERCRSSGLFTQKSPPKCVETSHSGGFLFRTPMIQ